VIVSLQKAILRAKTIDRSPPVFYDPPLSVFLRPSSAGAS
jgi:hypothetical protein